MRAAGARRRGPAPRFSREQLVDDQGFAALSLRSVARQLEVGPMTLYTYVDSSEELAGLVVNRLVDDAVRGVRWPRTWQGVLTVLAKKLNELVTEHPSMVEAYGRGIVRSRPAGQVAEDVLERLVAGGLSPTRAREAYVAVHSLVLGFALIRGHDAASDPSAASELLLRLVGMQLDGLAP